MSYSDVYYDLLDVDFSEMDISDLGEWVERLQNCLEEAEEEYEKRTQK